MRHTLLSNLAPSLSFHQQKALFVQVIQMNGRELENFLEKEIEKNPLLQYQNSPSLPGDTKDLVYRPSIYTSLLEQIRLLFSTTKEKKIAKYIVGNLDAWGFLDLSPQEIARATNSSEKMVENVLSLIQSSVEPKGIASKNYQQYLLGKLPVDCLLYNIIEKDFSLLLSGKLSQIQKKYRVTTAKMEALFSELKKIMPTPISSQSKGNYHVEPDIYFFKEKKWTFKLKECFSNLSWDPKYHSLRGANKEEKKVISSYKAKGKWLMQALHQRKECLEKIATYLLKNQSSFFQEDEKISPLSQKKIAEDLSLHISTISRIFSSKYADLEGRIVPLSIFLSHDVNNFSSVEIKKKIKEICRNFPNYSDEKIRQHLAAENIQIARRTVAKYRKELSLSKRNIRSLLSNL